MKESIAKKHFEAWWLIHGMGGDKQLAWEAYKLGIKLTEIYKD